MKMKKYILPMLPALLLASCSNDEPAPAANGDSAAAVVNADIAGMRKSRAYDDQWEANDKIGISGTTGDVTYTNVPYVTAGDGAFTALNGVAEGIFFQNKEEAVFSAYYPYNEDVTADNRIIEANTTVQAVADSHPVVDFDFLYATGAKGSVTNPGLSFTGNAAFSHRMAQLVINVTPDKESGFEGIDILENGTATLDGLALDGQFDTESGEAEATGEPAAWTLTGNVDQTIAAATGTATSMMIVFPQKQGDVKYSIEHEGVKYSCLLDLNLEAGHRYTYSIALKKTGLTVIDSVITDWIDEDGGDIDAGIEPDADPFEGHEAVLMRAASDDAPALYFATCNLGADNDEAAGLFYWWGDTEGHADATDFYFGGSYNKAIFTYNKSVEELGDILTADGVLSAEYDAAQVNWGGAWRLPTAEELQWLLNNCTRKKVTRESGRIGHEFTSKETGNTIFLPLAGNLKAEWFQSDNDVAGYWSSNPDTRDALKSQILSIAGFGPSVRSLTRDNGYSIRAVATL